jgi:hypothetical protein
MDPAIALLLIAFLFGAYLGAGLDAHQHRNDEDA